jgi:CYTH domain-containing protein
MALEIERRFFVIADGWQELVQRSEYLQQGYLSMGKTDFSVRVRCNADQAWLTIKAPTTDLMVRHEFELAMPLTEAQQLLALTPARLKKTRHHLKLTGGDWVVDVFDADNAPLVIAEVEIIEIDTEIVIPPWCGTEISRRGDLTNAALATNPWKFRPPEGQLLN